MADLSTPSNDPAPALLGVRVLEVSYSRQARIAGQMLADLGADVVRLVLDGSPRTAAGETGDISWDRGKRVLHVDSSYVAAHVHEADIFIIDESPSRLEALSLGAAHLNPKDQGFVHIWVPPYGPVGEWAEFVEDPLLIASAVGISGQYAGARNGPVAPVVSNLAQVHGGLAAAAAMAGLHGLETTGHGYSATVTGLHAASACTTSSTFETLDTPTIRRAGGAPSPIFRSYEAGDKQWFYLAALTPDQLMRILDTLDRLDIYALPGVAGDFYQLMGNTEALEIMTEAFEARFRTEPRDHWIDLFSARGIAAAPVTSRAEWAESEIVAANGGFVIAEDENVGPVRMPSPPIMIDGAAPVPGPLPVAGAQPEIDEPLWVGARAARPEATGEYLMPLAGVNILDAASFIAGPFITSLLSEYGADVTRVEAPEGEPYRAFAIQYLATNKYKRGLALNIQAPEGVQTMLDLIRNTDILVENLRPARMERIGLGDEALKAANSRLVHVGVSAYGLAEAWADSPGFDPVFQGRSGMATAQGGDGPPCDSMLPTIDGVTGVVGAIGALAGLRRQRHQHIGAKVGISLAQSVTFLQYSEFTTYQNSPATAVGGIDHRGPSDFHRLYECSDVWIAINADSEDKRQALLEVMNVTEASQLESSLRTLTGAQALAKLSGVGIEAVRVVDFDTFFTDPFVEANELTYTLMEKDFGRAVLVRAFSDWSTTQGRRPPASIAIGADSVAVLADAGFSEQRIEELINSGVVTVPTPVATPVH